MTIHLLSDTFEVTDIRTEMKGEGESAVNVGIFEGYASTFGNADRIGDIIAPGAFKEAIQEPIPMLWQHRMNEQIGVFPEWRQDKKGLYVVGEINLETQRGRDAYALIKAGHMRHMSVGFRTDAYDERKDQRIITRATLVEISLVTIPMNPKAQIVSVKSLLEANPDAAHAAGLAALELLCTGDECPHSGEVENVVSSDEGPAVGGGLVKALDDLRGLLGDIRCKLKEGE